MRWLPPLLLAILIGGPAMAAAERSPRVNYMLNCQGCHLPDGSGTAGKVPTMRGNLANFLGVEGGRAYLVRVPGTANSKLSDADVAALLNWLIPEMGPGQPVFQPYSAEEVRTLRADRLQEVAKVRAALIEAMPTPKQ